MMDLGVLEDVVESLDFVDVDFYWARRARGRGVFFKVLVKWIVVVFIGVGVGMIVFFIDVLVFYVY